MTSPSDKRASGNPAKQAQIDLTVKQQREQKRQEKLAEYQKQVAKRKRGKLVWWVVGSTAAVAVIGLVIASFAFAPAPPRATRPATAPAARSAASRRSRTAPTTCRAR